MILCLTFTENTPSLAFSFLFCGQTKPMHGTLWTVWCVGQAPYHTAGPAWSHLDQCSDPGRKLSQLLCPCAGLTTQVAVGGGRGQSTINIFIYNQITNKFWTNYSGVEFTGCGCKEMEIQWIDCLNSFCSVFCFWILEFVLTFNIFCLQL